MNYVISAEKIQTLERIKAIREKFGYNRSKFAAALNLSRSAVSEFENGVRKPSKDFILSLPKLGVSIDWFVSGEGEMMEADRLTSKPAPMGDFHVRELTSKPDFPLQAASGDGIIEAAPEKGGPPGSTDTSARERNMTATAERAGAAPRIMGEIPLIYAGDERLERGIIIPFLEDQALSAGPGAELDEGDNPTRYLRVPAYLARYPDLTMLPVKGDSMDPTLHDGDLVVCDGGGWDGDGIYVIKTEDKAFVKRVVFTPDGYQIISDNKMYPTYGARNENMAIVGKVRAAVIAVPGRRGGV